MKELDGTHGWGWPNEMKSMVVVWTCDDDQAPGLGTEEREKQKGLKAKVKHDSSFLVW